MPYLFAYGSLRYGFELHGLLKNSRFVGLAFTEGYKMYDVGSYPGVVKGEGVIYGEVYEIDDETLSILDKVEDYRGRPDDLYIREKVKVYFDDRRKYSLSDVNIYVYNQDIAGRDLIEEGDYSKYVRMPVILNYFAYAENTNEEILRQRGLKKILNKINAVAKGYRMIFNIPCRWGYCANLIEDPQGKICGYVYLMLEDELNSLDKAENHLVKYMREVIRVEDEQGREYYAYAYISSNKENIQKPSEEYLNLIIQGLRKGWGNKCKSSGL